MARSASLAPPGAADVHCDHERNVAADLEEDEREEQRPASEGGLEGLAELGAGDEPGADDQHAERVLEDEDRRGRDHVGALLDQDPADAPAQRRRQQEKGGDPHGRDDTVGSMAVLSPEQYLAELNPAQAEAVLATDGPLLVFAGAGSGKTRVIIYRIANLVAAPPRAARTASSPSPSPTRPRAR